MQRIFVITCLVALAKAQYPNAISGSHYSPPPSYSAPASVQQQQSYNPPQPSYNQPPAYGPPQQQSYQPPQQYQRQSTSNHVQEQPENKIVFKHVFVSVAKDDEPTNQQIRRIKGPGGNEKHVKIIFVKAPAAAAPDQQVVELAQANERKTLVYVLLKKAADAPDVQFANPAPTSASKPEVYFIRYKDQQKAAEASAANLGSQYGAPTNAAPQYGAPVPN